LCHVLFSFFVSTYFLVLNTTTQSVRSLCFSISPLYYSTALQLSLKCLKEIVGNDRDTSQKRRRPVTAGLAIAGPHCADRSRGPDGDMELAHFGHPEATALHWPLSIEYFSINHANRFFGAL